ncbi:alpha/beta hydrolase [Sphaerospermopsis aphanizomenoides BCCUSP55]|uniref:alpha/beta hydrolase n=1 Tax=Sphaerospermopsis aphanizomenoides TaxID=459663 RepID=UPI000AF36674|nr:alpha/beta hydrolase [Sphaerospermopsis aphanizomenoides]MBK1989556.1 alpha/beta hydrolase [Sphaerospermopsis aphanizomenoides BCCUSP55]
MSTKKSWKNLKIIAGLFSAIPAVSVAMTLTQLVFTNSSAQAADKLVVRYGPLEESASLADLKTAAQTGELPASLGTYTKRLTKQQRNFLVRGLKTRVPVNVVTLNRLLNTQLGNTVLNDISQALVREDKAGVQAIRAGLILGANSPQGLSVLSFIAAYPSQNLEINVPQALTVARTLNMAFWRTQQFMLTMTPRIDPSKLKLAYSLDPTQPGSAQVQILNLNLNDEKRQRQIPLDIYWSNSASTEKPVIVFSHGFGLVRTDLRYLAEHLASHGYVVAALEHPGSNFTSRELALKNKTPLLKPQEFVDRPRDISFVVDELAKLNQTANNPLQGKLLTNNVMVVGYSFGGTTALALGGGELQIASLKQSCEQNAAKLTLLQNFLCVAKELPENSYQLRDERIKQIVALSPATSLLFGETGLTKVQVPTLVLTGSADDITPALSEQIISFAKVPSPKWLVAAVGGTHLSVVDPNITSDPQGKTNSSIPSREVVGKQAADVRKYVKAITLAMAAQLTPEASKYSVFLSPDYAQIASTPVFPFRLLTEIPPSVMGVIPGRMEK